MQYNFPVDALNRFLKFYGANVVVLRNLLEGIGEARLVGDGEVEVRDIAFHTDRVAEGSLFVALPGIRNHGNAFVHEAVVRGANTIVSDQLQNVSPGIVQIVVPDPRQALAKLSARFFGEPSRSLLLVGVTGTNGKTTISYLLESIFQAAGLCAGLMGTVEHRYAGFSEPATHTTPAAYDVQRLLRSMVNHSVRACAMEVSSHALEQQRVAGCHFNGAIFTNLTTEHLDYHPHMEGYYQAKAKLFSEILAASDKPDRFAIINQEDAYGARLQQATGEIAWSYAAQATDADVYCRRWEPAADGMNLDMMTPEGPLTLSASLVGRFNISNIAAAVAAALRLHLPHGAIAGGIAAVQRVPGRFERVPNSYGITTIVDYAHTPDALHNALVEARALTAGRLVVVFGCGGDRDRGKRPLMGKVAAELADAVIVTSDNPRTEDPLKIIEDIVVGVEPSMPRLSASGRGYEAIADRREALSCAMMLAKRGDVIVVAGKGHEDYQLIGTTKHRFDDREELERLSCA